MNLCRYPGWFRPGLLAGLWLGARVLHTGLAFGSGKQFSAPLPAALLSLYKIGEIGGMLTAWFCLNGVVRWCMARPWFRWLTGFSFMIYVLHGLFVNYATEPALRYGHGGPHLYMVLPLLIVAVSVGLGAGRRGAAPGVYAVLTGGRGLATS